MDVSVRQSRRVITPSEHARRAVQEHYRLPDDRVLVAPLAVDPDFLVALAAAERRLPHDHHRVLMVGTVLPRKNVPAVARAVARLRAGGDDVRLRLVGPTPEAGRKDLQLARDALGEALEVRGAVSPEVLASEYASAHVFAFPSYYEGFGIPLLEAMAAGTPVVSSDATCLPEVAGSAAQLVAPEDAVGWVEALRRAVETPRPWQVLGASRVADFSWGRTADVVRVALAEASAG